MKRSIGNAPPELSRFASLSRNPSLPGQPSNDPYFCLHFIMVFVRDQERSLQFYVDQLGFRLVVDHRFESGGRWIEVAPPDGNASLSLALATPDSEAYKLIGQDTRISFITEDVNAKFDEWSRRGVRFQEQDDITLIVANCRESLETT